MKYNSRNLTEIIGVELNNLDKQRLKGGEDLPCDIKCTVFDSESNKISGPDCCPFSTIAECEYEANSYFFLHGIPHYASCSEVEEQ